LARAAPFITLEGGEGAGKSTQVRRLEKKLVEKKHRVLLTREPGGSAGAEAIRGLLVTGDVARWTPITEALLHFAARADHLEKTIRPALNRGDWVICDRFVDSTLAYQGIAQGLGKDPIMALRKLVIGPDMPQLTFILDLPVEVGLARAGARAGAEDRYERMDKSFHEKLRTAFLDIAKAEPERCVIIDATVSEAEVEAHIWSEVTKRFAP